MGIGKFYRTPVGKVRANVLARTGVNYGSTTLEFFLLALRDFRKEASRVNQEIRSLRMLEAQGIACADKPEQIEFVKATTSKMIGFLLEETHGLAPKKKEDQGAARLLKNKKDFMRQTVTQGKKFGSLSEILQAVGKSLNQLE